MKKDATDEINQELKKLGVRDKKILLTYPPKIFDALKKDKDRLSKELKNKLTWEEFIIGMAIVFQKSSMKRKK